MKKISINLFLAITILTITVSCDNDNDPNNNVCDDNYASDLIIAAFSNTNDYLDSIEWAPFETNEYQIQINANGEICTIGYQNPTTYSGAYTMEIINITTGVSYSGIHSFLDTGLDYQPITPVPVSSGDIITVRRTILPGYTSSNELIGRALIPINGLPVPYPITIGNVVFLSSSLYGGGSPPDNNIVQPYIAFGFKVN